MLKQSKRNWSSSLPKYATFWDANQVLDKLKKETIHWENEKEIRDRCIIILRLLHLHRSIDLARMKRKLASGKYIAVRRKGQNKPRWEELIEMPIKTISPLHLIKRYVHLTRNIPPGGALFHTITRPRKPLTANSIGRITKEILEQKGIPTNVFGPHSTRGAAVKMYKAMGLSSEQVCELGQWKNTAAFTEHYLRMDAAMAAKRRLEEVHKVSSWNCGTTDGSRSPRRERTQGRRDPEGGTQEQDEPTLPPEEEEEEPPTFAYNRSRYTANCRRRSSSKEREFPRKP